MSQEAIVWEFRRNRVQQQPRWFFATFYNPLATTWDCLFRQIYYYSPDWAHNEYFQYENLKRFLGGKKLASKGEIVVTTIAFFWELPLIIAVEGVKNTNSKKIISFTSSTLNRRVFLSFKQIIINMYYLELPQYNQLPE